MKSHVNTIESLRSHPGAAPAIIYRNRVENNWGIIDEKTDDDIASFSHGVLVDVSFVTKESTWSKDKDDPTKPEIIGVAKGLLIQNVDEVVLPINNLHRLCFNKGFCDKSMKPLCAAKALILGADGTSFFVR